MGLRGAARRGPDRAGGEDQSRLGGQPRAGVPGEGHGVPVAAESGPERTGIRISPVTPANDVSDGNPQPLFDYITDHLNALKLVYIHVIEGATGGPRDIAPFDYGSLRARFRGTYIANNGYDLELANKVLAANEADLIAFGKPFIANPDLVERLQRGAPLNAPDKATFYGGGAKGYTDYPALGETLHAAQQQMQVLPLLACGER